MSRYLVAGGCGFIGSALVKSLIDDGHSVLNIDLMTYAAVPGALETLDGNSHHELVVADISDEKSMRVAFADFSPDVFLNLAAESHVDRSIDDAGPFLTTNVMGVACLLRVATDWWIDHGRDPGFRFVQVSTDEVFGSIRSGSFTTESRYRPTSPYSASKAAGDLLTRAWFHTYGLPTIVTNASNTYGPFQHPEKLIPLMTVHAVDERSLPLYGHGRHARDWIHVDDHVAGLIAAATRGRPGATYLFGSGTSRTNREVTVEICRLVDNYLGRPPETSEKLIVHVDDRPGHDARYCIDPTEAQNDLAWRPVIPFESGIESTVRWYATNQDWWRPLARAGATARKGLAP